VLKHRFLPGLLASLFPALIPTGSTIAGEPAHRNTALAQEWQQLRRGLEKLQKVEFVEMLTAILKGSQMGPGDGWFHPGQSRYGWQWLAARHHKEKNGTITAKEFQGPAAWFKRLDRNRDGVLSAADFDERALAKPSPATMLFSMIDGNSNGRISKAEWEEFFNKLAKEKGYLTPNDLRDALQPPPPKTKGPPKGAPTTMVLLEGLLKGELGSAFEGPKVGQKAPNFTLKTHDGKQDITLSDYQGKKPVVLIFGSFT
jgi:hypothetical protein